MSIATLRSGLLIVIATVAVLPLLSAPAFAEKKGAAPRAVSAHQTFCDYATASLASAETDADLHAGTPAAAPYAKAADAWYSKGAKAGCWRA